MAEEAPPQLEALFHGYVYVRMWKDLPSFSLLRSCIGWIRLGCSRRHSWQRRETHAQVLIRQECPEEVCLTGRCLGRTRQVLPRCRPKLRDVTPRILTVVPLWCGFRCWAPLPGLRDRQGPLRKR